MTIPTHIQIGIADLDRLHAQLESYVGCRDDGGFYDGIFNQIGVIIAQLKGEIDAPARVASIVIDFDQDADSCWGEREPGDDAERVMLETIAYDADSNVIGGLCGSEFYADENDWVTGTFHRVSDIPERCEHLREIAKDLGLPL